MLFCRRYGSWFLVAFHTSSLHLQGVVFIFDAGIMFHISVRNVCHGRTVLSQDWCGKYAPKSLSCDKICKGSLCDRFVFSYSICCKFWRVFAVIGSIYHKWQCCKIVAKMCCISWGCIFETKSSQMCCNNAFILLHKCAKNDARWYRWHKSAIIMLQK